MNTNEINQILLNSVPDTFKGTYPVNQLPNHFDSFPTAVVANTDPWPKPGAHWVALYFPNSQKVEYFCSYACPPKPLFINYLNQFDRIKVNPKRVQGDFSAVCGQYCIYYILKRSQGLKMKEIVAQFNQGNLQENDEMIKCYVNDNFNLDMPTYNWKFIEKQICHALCLLDE